MPAGASRPDESEPLTPDKIDFAYAVYWTKTAREWDAGRRRSVAEAVTAVINSPHFRGNAFARAYRVEGLDESAHSGASLLALQRVLRAMEAGA